MTTTGRGTALSNCGFLSIAEASDAADHQPDKTTAWAFVLGKLAVCHSTAQQGLANEATTRPPHSKERGKSATVKNA